MPESTERGRTAGLRWPRVRFSLLAMFIMTLAAALLFRATITPMTAKARALARLEAVGGFAWMDDGFPEIDRSEVSEPYGAWLRRVLSPEETKDVTNVVLAKAWRAKPAEFDDADAALLLAFPKLRFLKLEGTRITDAGLLTLAGLPELEKLTLKGDRFTDEGLSRFRSLRPTVKVVLKSP
ncbi:MAG TPA: leucine-rich repeat domain-containing protein [Pirellulales bacterium]